MLSLSNEDRNTLADMFRLSVDRLEAEKLSPERSISAVGTEDEDEVEDGSTPQIFTVRRDQLESVSFPNPSPEGLSEQEYIHQLSESMVLNHVFQNWRQYGVFQPPPKEVKRRTPREKDGDFWITSWGRRLLHPDTKNPKSTLGKLFRRRFRLPYPVFVDFVEQCKLHNVFDLKYQRFLPVELKILVCLRILGRDHTADDCNDSCDAIGISTVRSIFHTFVENVCKRMFHRYVGFPTGNRLEEVLNTYAKLGLPGCVGSFDCTHVKWSMCPAADRWYAVGTPYSAAIIVVTCN